MNDSLMKVLAAERLLGEVRQLLKGDELALSLRQETDCRADLLDSDVGRSASPKVDNLQTLVGQNCKFGTIYADPPWPYKNESSRGAAVNHYPTMDLQAICALPVLELAADLSHLHLWTTNAFLFDAQRVLEAWGFSYKSCLVWIKPQLGNGNYWRVSHEFLLLGVRGNMPFTEKAQQSWLYAERAQHSVKPAIFRKLIERVSPPPRLELFARRQADGWTTWGNDIERDLFTLDSDYHQDS